MAIKKKNSGGGGANWMDTYGDMVTLLLCFFVLLYSMSSISEDKWKAIVASFNPNAVKTQTETPTGGDGPNADVDEGQGGPQLDPNSLVQNLSETEMTAFQQEISDALEKLYQAMNEYTEESEAGQNIDVTKGDGYVFVSFNDAVFFDGDSFDLRPDGEQVLSTVAGILSQAAPYIDEVRILGHTAQADPNVPNNPYKDRLLAAQRATVATWYIQTNSTLDPARLVSMGYGQHRPIAPNDTKENRSKNRRVEMVITGLDLYDQLGDSIEQYHTLRTGEAGLTTSNPTDGTDTTTPVDSAGPVESTAPAESAAPVESAAP